MKHLISFLLIFFLLNSCNKENFSDTTAPFLSTEDFVYNGEFFEFEDVEDFMKQSKIIDALPQDEFRKFENDIGYQSVQGNYDRVFEEYSTIENEEELERFFYRNEDKVNFIKIDDDFTDLEPLLINTTKYVRKLLGSSNLLRIGEKICHFTEDYQFIYDLKDLATIRDMIEANNIDNIEEFGVEKYPLKNGVQLRFDQECKSEQKPKWFCQKVRVRGRMDTGAFIFNGFIDVQWNFETKSFGYSPPFYLPVKANNRISASFTASVTTELGTANFSFTIPLATHQDSWNIERSVATGLIAVGSNGTFSVSDNGISTHNLTRFSGSCHYNITCGLSF